VRARVAAGQPIRYLVPPAVEQFIFEQHLYTPKRHSGGGVSPRITPERGIDTVS
jgi:hypothetical protein